MKILTVSIAAYNAEAYIRTALDSLISSVCMNELEVFVIDDGGTDQTLSIATEYAKKYPKSIFPIHKKNGGWGSTVNYSIEHAAGKYLRILDGDDWIDTVNLPKLLAFLGKTDADMILSPYYEFQEKTCEKVLIDHHQYFDVLEHPVTMKDIRLPLMMHEMIVKVKVFRSNGVRLCEKCFYTDNEFLFYALYISHIVTRFPDPIYCYRIGRDGQSISLPVLRKHYLELTIVSESIYDHYSAIRCQRCIVLPQLQQVLQAITGLTYRAFLLVEPTRQHRKELLQWDRQFRDKFPEIYEMTEQKRVIRMARLLRFRPYKVLCAMAKKRFSRG